MDRLPLIDLRTSADEIAQGIGEACRAQGFFYVIGHGIDESLGQRLEDLSRRFFALPEATKARYAMPLGGTAARSFSPRGLKRRRYCAGDSATLRRNRRPKKLASW
jgi:isopenicillin N synthase-like dioxygenase